MFFKIPFLLFFGYFDDTYLTPSDGNFRLNYTLFFSIEYSAKTACGYATVKDVRDHTLEDRMESFFLAETTKYLYLLFDTENEIIHQSKGHVVQTPFGECVVEAGGWIFNTEAHPVDAAALDCCSGKIRH